MIPKVQPQKKKTDKLDFTKIKTSVLPKKKKKKHIKNENNPQYGEKKLAIYIPDK